MANPDPCAAQESPEGAAPAAEDAAPEPIASPRELLDIYRIDESQLRALVDRRPLAPDEDEVLQKIMYRIPRFDLLDLERWQRDDVSWAQLVDDPEAHRIDAFRLRGRATAVERVDLIPEVVGRYEYDAYWRVRLEMSDAAYPVVVLAREVPEAWKQLAEKEEPLDQPAGFLGVFLKVGQCDEQQSELVFAARRVQWYPVQVTKSPEVFAEHVELAAAGVDIGLLDQVADGQSFEVSDRECFYQMLAAVERIEAKPKPPTDDADKIAQMIERPKQQHGRRFVLEGTARRAIKVLIGEDDDDIRQRYGIDHYYMLHVFVPLEQTLVFKTPYDTEGKAFSAYPVVACVRELPEGMPKGQDIHEPVRISGYYFKLWAYQTKFMSGDDGQGQRKQVSPTLIGPEPEWIQSTRSDNPYVGIMFGAFFILAVLGIWFGLWRYSRSDREFEQSTLTRQFELDADESLDEMGIEARDKPDFSGLDEPS